MTPDMKRLCEAAEAVLQASTSITPGQSGSAGTGISRQSSVPMTVTISTEAIVRAVLTALREQMMGEEIGSETDLWTAADPQRLYPGTEGFDHQFANVINHILGEPASA